MSDVSNPEFNKPDVSTDSTVDHATLPHSGDAGIEFPVNDFDNTPLHQAVSEGLISTPDDPSSLAQEFDTDPDEELFGNEQKRGHGKLIVGVSTLLAAGLGFASLTMSGNNKDSRNSDVSAVTAPTTPSTSALNTNGTIKSETAQEDYPNALNLLRILATDKTIDLERNGKIYKIPKLRDPNGDPKLFAESAFALWACYLTSGKQECLDEFTQDKKMREFLTNQRDTDYVRLQSTAGTENTQAGFIDSIEDPALFKSSYNTDGFLEINLVGGSLFYGAQEYDPGWQQLTTTFRDGDLKVTSLKFEVTYTYENNIKSPRISYIFFETVPAKNN